MSPGTTHHREGLDARRSAIIESASEQRTKVKREIEHRVQEGEDCNRREASDRNYHFYPRRAIQEIFDGGKIEERVRRLCEYSEVINGALGPNPDDFIRLMKSKDEEQSISLILAILVYIDTPVNSEAWRFFMQEVQSGRLNDARLPFAPTSTTASNLGVRFSSEQYKFCPVILRGSKDGLVRLQDHNASCRLPYLQEKLIGQGSAGSVYMVKIAQGCCKWATQQQESEGVPWARKDMQLTDSSAELKMAEQHFKGRARHRYMVETLGGLRYMDRVSLFFERAVSDLEAFMNCTETFELVSALGKMLDVLTALRHLHSEITIDQQLYRCYHLDIKPQNVLVFEDPTGVIFKIADFSISKIKKGKHTPENALNHYTSSSVSTAGVNDACICVAPEATVEEPEISEYCDIWSYGCTLCLVLVWAYAGRSALQRFREHLTTPQPGRKVVTSQFYAECPPTKSLTKMFRSRSIEASFRLNHWVQDWFVNSGSQYPNYTVYFDTWRCLEKHALVVDPSGRSAASELYGLLRQTVYNPGARSSSDTHRPRSQTSSTFRKTLRPRNPPSTRSGSSAKSWRLQVASDGAVLKCRSSPAQKPKYVAFLHRTVVEIFEMSPDRPLRDDEPVVKISISDFSDDSSSEWQDCCFNEDYLFVVPKFTTRLERRRFAFIAFPLVYFNSRNSTPEYAIRIETPCDRRIEHIAAAPGSRSSLACVVLDKVTKARPGDKDTGLIWDVMTLTLNGLEQVSELNVDSPTASDTLKSIRKTVAIEIKSILERPNILSPESTCNPPEGGGEKPVQYSDMESVDLQFSSDGTSIILTSELRHQHDIFLFWWSLENGEWRYHGKSQFINSGIREEQRKAHTGTFIVEQGTVLLLRYNISLHLRTPTFDGSAAQFVRDDIETPEIPLQLATASPDARSIFCIGESKKKRSFVAIYLRRLNASMEFKRPRYGSLDWTECATASTLRFDRFRGKPGIALLYSPSEWDGIDKHVMLLVDYTGSAEVLELSMSDE